MGWVETGSCRRYSQSAGDSALASLPPDANNKGALPALRSHACSNFLCAQALKVALQLSCYAGNQQVCLVPPQGQAERCLSTLHACPLLAEASKPCALKGAQQSTVNHIAQVLIRLCKLRRVVHVPDSIRLAYTEHRAA